jgi:hypothetical protein
MKIGLSTERRYTEIMTISHKPIYLKKKSVNTTLKTGTSQGAAKMFCEQLCHLKNSKH